MPTPRTAAVRRQQELALARRNGYSTYSQYRAAKAEQRGLSRSQGYGHAARAGQPSISTIKRRRKELGQNPEIPVSRTVVAGDFSERPGRRKHGKTHRSKRFTVEKYGSEGAAKKAAADYWGGQLEWARSGMAWFTWKGDYGFWEILEDT